MGLTRGDKDNRSGGTCHRTGDLGLDVSAALLKSCVSICHYVAGEARVKEMNQEPSESQTTCP